MIKNFISLILAILFSLGGCTFSLNNRTLYLNRGNCISINSAFDSPLDCNYEIIGKNPQQLMEKYGSPELINDMRIEHYEKQSEQSPIVSICYKNNKRKLFGKEPPEYCYIGFDEETKLANTVICPWYLSDE